MRYELSTDAYESQDLQEDAQTVRGLDLNKVDGSIDFFFL